MNDELFWKLQDIRNYIENKIDYYKYFEKDNKKYDKKDIIEILQDIKHYIG